MSETATYLEEVVARLRALLGDAVVGLYAGGSFVLGGYDPNRSDLDVAAVCRGDLADEEKTAVVEALRHESLPCPARGLEFVLYPEPTAREPAADAGYELDLNTGRAMPFRLSADPGDAPRHWYVIDRAILREHGRALYGPPPHEVFGAFERETLLTMLSESVGWHAASPDARHDDAVLNACRALRYSAEGVWSSKPAAGEWALTRVRERDLVSDALAARSGDEQPSRERVAAFLRRVQAVLAGAAEGGRGSRP